MVIVKTVTVMPTIVMEIRIGKVSSNNVITFFPIHAMLREKKTFVQCRVRRVLYAAKSHKKLHVKTGL